jgi:hypothetical protein
MPIKNYSTQVEAAKTCQEISLLLAAIGALRIQAEHDETQQPTALSLTYPVYGIPVRFQLPCNIEGVRKCLQKQKGVSYSQQSSDHARNVAWRIVKNWVDAQLAIVDSGAVQMVEIFLPHAVQQDGKAMFALFDETYANKQLRAPSAEAIEQ